MLRGPWYSPLFLSILLVGCTSHLDMRVQTSQCLNPSEYCNEQGSNSKVLDIYIYQLVEPIPNYHDQHALLSDPSVVVSGDLAAFLAEPHIQALDPTSITLHRNQSTVFTIERRKKTKYLLFVTDGRQVEDNSIVLMPISRFQDKTLLCIEYYGTKYIEPLAENYCHFEFKLPTTTGIIEKETDQ